jgi:hypothetical protein
MSVNGKSKSVDNKPTPHSKKTATRMLGIEDLEIGTHEWLWNKDRVWFCFLLASSSWLTASAILQTRYGGEAVQPDWITKVCSCDVLHQS